MKRQLPRPEPLGDVPDLEEAVRRIVQTTPGLWSIDEDEREELVAQGFLEAYELKARPETRSVKAALSSLLGKRLINARKRWNREFRDNRRAGTTRTIEIEPIHARADDLGDPVAHMDFRHAESRINLGSLADAFDQDTLF
jgi:hypothetical protein